MKSFLLAFLCLFYSVLIFPKDALADTSVKCEDKNSAIKQISFGMGANSQANITGSCGNDSSTFNIEDVVKYSAFSATSNVTVKFHKKAAYTINITPLANSDNCVAYQGTYDTQNYKDGQPLEFTHNKGSDLTLSFNFYHKRDTAGCEDKNYNNLTMPIKYSVTIKQTSAGELDECRTFADTFPTEKQTFVMEACKFSPQCFSKELYENLYTCCDGKTGDCIQKGWYSGSKLKMCNNSIVCDDTKFNSSSGLYEGSWPSDTVCDPKVPWDSIKACQQVNFQHNTDGSSGGGIPPLNLNVQDLTISDLESVNPLANSTAFQNDENRTPGAIINRALKTIVFPVAGVLLLILILWGGFQMLQASLSGKQNFIELGRNRVVAAIIGFILLFASYWLWSLVEIALGLGAK